MEKIYKGNQVKESLPQKVKKLMIEDIEMFDYYYGENRNIDYQGGYIYLLESKEDLDEVLSVWDLRNPSVIPEVVEEIKSDPMYVRILLIAGAEYHIIYYIKNELVPQRILEYM